MTNWSLSVDLTIFQENLTLKSGSENPQKFELNAPFAIQKNKVVEGLKTAKINVPENIQKLIPNDTSIDRLVIDSKAKTFEVAIRINFGEGYIVNTYPDLVNLESAALSISKGETDHNENTTPVVRGDDDMGGV